MKPDYHKSNEGEQYNKKKSKSSVHKEKKSQKHSGKDKFRNYVQDILDNRHDKDYDIEEE